MNLTYDENRILKFLKLQSIGFSTLQIAKQFGHSSHGWAERNCKRLLKYGLVIRDNAGKIIIKSEETYRRDKTNAERIINKLLYEVKPCSK